MPEAKRISFVVEGQAQPKGSTVQRANSYGQSWITSANPNMRDWQEDVAWSAEVAMKREKRAAMQGPVILTVTFYLQRPKSLPDLTIAHVKKPDLDKLLRCVGDALTGVCYRDDSQVVDVHAFKRYAAHTPHTTVVVEESRV